MMRFFGERLDVDKTPIIHEKVLPKRHNNERVYDEFFNQDVWIQVGINQGTPEFKFKPAGDHETTIKNRNEAKREARRLKAIQSAEKAFAKAREEAEALADREAGLNHVLSKIQGDVLEEQANEMKKVMTETKKNTTALEAVGSGNSKMFEMISSALTNAVKGLPSGVINAQLRNLISDSDRRSMRKQQKAKKWKKSAKKSIRKSIKKSTTKPTKKHVVETVDDLDDFSDNSNEDDSEYTDDTEEVLDDDSDYTDDE